MKQFMSYVRSRTERPDRGTNNGRSPVTRANCVPRLDIHIDLEIFTMNQLKHFSAGWPAVLMASVLGLGGCAGMTQQEKGTATGAVIGGVAGNVVGGGILGTAAGAAVGGVIGHEVTKPKR